MIETCRRLEKAWDEGKRVRILYCGDLDPSGDAMDEIIEENLNLFFDIEEFKENGIYSFERIGVLYEHIDKFGLEANPDPAVLKKLKEEPRAEKFMKKYDLKSKDELFQVEIDALAGLAPEQFKKMILDRIEKYYDPSVYVKLLSDPKHSEGQISLHVMKNVRQFIKDYQIKSFMESIF
jgi:hypothetical protein